MEVVTGHSFPAPLLRLIQVLAAPPTVSHRRSGRRQPRQRVESVAGTTGSGALLARSLQILGAAGLCSETAEHSEEHLAGSWLLPA